MVRSLSGSLTTAVNAATRVPAVAVTCEDHIQHFASYQTPAGSDGYTDCCIANDGSIVRVRVTRGGNSLQQNFQFQRITTPATGSQWTSWTTFSGGSANMFQDGFCAISNNSGNIRAFAQRSTGGTNLWVWTSTNNGSSWTGPVSVLTPPSAALIKGITSAGNNDVFFIYDVVGGEAIGCSFFTSSWSSLATWTLATITGGSGLANYWDSGNSKYWIVYSDGYALKECTCNSAGASWASLPDIAPTSSTAIARISPRIAFNSYTSLYDLVCCETDLGILSGSVYNYPRLRQSADLLHWSSGTIFHDITTSYDAKIIHRAADTATYLISMPSVFRSPDYSQATATQYLDVSSKILSYTREEQINKPAKLEIVLDNNAGALNSKVSDNNTNYEPIGLNCSIILNEGYKTGSPPTTVETVKVATYHINMIQFQRSPEENQIRITAYDKSRNLDIVNRFQNTYTNQTLSWMVSEICARAGFFSPSLPVTSQMSQTIGTFVLQSGQTYRKALDELCGTYALEYFMDQTETMVFRELQNSDSSVWTYQPEIEQVTFGYDDERGNHIIVTGKPPLSGQVGALTTGEAYDDTNMHLVGLERLVHYVDPKLGSTSQCSSKASFILSQEQRAQTAHQITVPVNPALQLIDVITVTDTSPGSGQSGTSRITKQSTHYNPQKTIYEHHVDLEGV